YEFWFEKFATSFCESFYSTSYNFEIIQVEIDNFIVYLENNKKFESNLIRLRNTDYTNYTTIGHRIRSFLKFYSFLIDEYLNIQSQPQLTLKEVQKIKENLSKYMTINKKIINNFSKSNKTIKKVENYLSQLLGYKIVKPLIFDIQAPMQGSIKKWF